MADDASGGEIQINIKGVFTRFSSNQLLANILLPSSSGPSELKLQISISTSKTVLELKQAIAEKADVEAERQRLIYSGI
jgi:hypothetical protein